MQVAVKFEKLGDNNSGMQAEWNMYKCAHPACP